MKMKTELAKLIDKWEIEKGSYIPNAPIYQAFIDEAKEALERESQVNNVVLDAVIVCDNCTELNRKTCFLGVTCPKCNKPFRSIRS